MNKDMNAMSVPQKKQGWGAMGSHLNKKSSKKGRGPGKVLEGQLK